LFTCTELRNAAGWAASIAQLYLLLAERYNLKQQADVAQLVEQLIRNQQVVSSSLTVGSSLFSRFCVLVAACNGPLEPNRAPVIHEFFIAAVVLVRLSTHTLGIIAERAVHPLKLFQEFKWEHFKSDQL
jgi:hypothetical protein